MVHKLLWHNNFYICIQNNVLIGRLETMQLLLRARNLFSFKLSNRFNTKGFPIQEYHLLKCYIIIAHLK